MSFFDPQALLDLLGKYLKTQFELVKLDVQDSLEQLMQRLLRALFALMALGLALLMFMFGLALYLNQCLESPYLGFVLVGGILLILAIALWLGLKKSITASEDESEE